MPMYDEALTRDESNDNNYELNPDFDSVWIQLPNKRLIHIYLDDAGGTSIDIYNGKSSENSPIHETFIPEYIEE
jgi:hypothetical protein